MRPHVFTAIVVIGLVPLAQPAASAEPQQRARAQARNAMRFQGWTPTGTGGLRATCGAAASTRDAFEWMDRNNDGVLSRIEVVGGLTKRMALVATQLRPAGPES